MAKTAVVNKKKKKKKSRKRNYGAAAANPKKRRKRRNPSAAPARRRAAPRRRNPSMFDMDAIMDVVPAATGGVWLGRWAVKLAGPFEPSQEGGVPEPGLKHAFAILIAANIGGDMLGNMMGSAAKGEYARIACLGFGGDMFLRKRFMRDSKFVTENLSLAGTGYDDNYQYDVEMEEPQTVSGFHEATPIGANSGSMVIGPDGQLYQMGMHQQQPALAGFSQTSSLGMAPARPSESSSFGYA